MVKKCRTWCIASCACLGMSLSVSAQNTIGVVLDEGGVQPGYTLYAPLSASTNTYLIDSLGRVVNSWTSSYRPANSVYLNEEGDLIRTVNPNISSSINGGAAGGRVERRSWDDTLEWGWNHISNTYRLHHDIEVLPNGNILMLAWESKSRPEVLAAGRISNSFQNTLWPEKIIEVEPSGTSGGTIVWEWHVWDHLVQDHDPSLPNYGDPSDYPHRLNINYTQSNSGPSASSADWLHCNAIDYDPERDQIVISSRNFNEIWIIDHSSTTEEAAGPAGDLLYRWGNPLAYGRGSAADQKLFGQHDPKWIRPGMTGYPGITIFNNGNGRPGGNYTSIDEIELPPMSNGTYEIADGAPYGPESLSWTYVASPANSFYSSFISGAERLENGNTLVCSGATGQFFEVTDEGEEIWRYITPLNQGGRMNQGENPPSGGGGGPGGGIPNILFRAERYSPSFAGFQGKDLSPTGYVEIYPECDADFDFNRAVDGGDLGLLLVYFGTNDPAIDLDSSGSVDGGDLGILLSTFGQCP